jgi:acyl-coenzyme A synthetase/AMP-(fatty) acid ligase
MSRVRSDRVPLATLLEGDPGDPTPVAFDRRGVRSRGELRRDALALAAAVERAGTGRWLLRVEDSYAATVSLLALARAGAVAVFPPNGRPETLRRGAEGCVGGLWDPASRWEAEAAGIEHRGIDPLDPPDSGPPTAPARLDRDRPLAEFWTSGTTGAGRAVSKALRHLEDEVVALEAALGGSLPPGTRIFATASHRHIYGLLFRVLWPLAARRAFQSETPLHAGELIPRMAECEAGALVTTPAHLKRLAPTEGLRPLRGICRAVFSSGGPLDAETAKSIAQQLGAAPVEVFGSTETGGVAVRRRDAHGESWIPLPGVAIRCPGADGRLEVTSPYVSVGESLGDGRGRVLMGDRVALAADGSFLLRGRADRVVKVGEKRLALPEMERMLELHPHVAEAALLVREQAGEGRVHAVVVPTAGGREALRRDGRRSFGAELTRHLAGSFDPVLLPRVWRTVQTLPRDAQDKVTVAALEALFARPAAADAAESRPEVPGPRILEEIRGEDAFERRLEVTDRLPQLEGHFDGFPVVAGVVQLGWAVDAAVAWRGRRPGIAGVEALKFPHPLQPGRTLTLRIERSRRGRGLRFRLHDGDDVFASGHLLLDEGDP